MEGAFLGEGNLNEMSSRGKFSKENERDFVPFLVEAKGVDGEGVALGAGQGPAPPSLVADRAVEGVLDLITHDI